MRKLLLCVPMIALLAGCGMAGVSPAEELALEIRGELLEMTACAARLSVTADYGQRVYQYQLAASLEGDSAQIQILAPETVAGCTVQIAGEDSTLEYGGLQVETGPMDPQGLTPLSAFSALMEGSRSGYITACALEEDGALLRVDCGDPEGRVGSGTETTLWFDTATHLPVRGEIAVDGFRAISCVFSEFSKR